MKKEDKSPIDGHVMFSFVGTAQEAGASGRSGAVGILVRGSVMNRQFPRMKTLHDQAF